MKRVLGFLKGFRNTIGYDLEFDLLDEQMLNSLPNCPGVYIITTTDGEKFNYPKGSNGVIYIGMSKCLKSRLKEHYNCLKPLEEDEDWGICDGYWKKSSYQYMHYHGAHVYIFKCRKQTQEAKDLESAILWRFYLKYRATPVGNDARSFPKIKDDRI